MAAKDRLAAAAELAGRAIPAADAADEQPMVPVYMLPPHSRAATK